MFIEPSHDALLDVQLMCTLLYTVALAGINYHLCFHPNVF